MPDRPAKFQLVEAKLGEPLDPLLATMRAGGDSFDRIARELWSRTGVEMTAQTVANWYAAAAS